MSSIDPKQLQSDLAGFTGSTQYYKSIVFCNWIFHTEGIQHLASVTGAFWLIDLIVSYQGKAKFKREDFQVWKLKRVEGRSFVIACTDGDKGDGPVTLCRQDIPFSDFPLDEITIYAEFGSLDGVNRHLIIMLPSER